MQFLHNLSIRAKIGLNAGLLIALMLASSLYAINSMQLIGGELVAIAEQDIPLTENITRITEHQLEQAIHVERAMRYAILSVNEKDNLKRFTKEVNYFEKLDKQVEKEILEGEKRAAEASENAYSEEDKVEFLHILQSLKDIEKEHHGFSAHVREAFALLRQGELQKANLLTRTIEEEEDQLTHELGALLKEVENFTQAAALKAEHHEIEALDTLMLMFGCRAR